MMFQGYLKLREELWSLVNKTQLSGCCRLVS